MTTSVDPKVSFVTGPSLGGSRIDLGSKAKSWRWLGTLKDKLSFDEDSDSEGEGASGGGGAGVDLTAKEKEKFDEEDQEALDRVFKNEGTADTAERMRRSLSVLAADLTAVRESAVVIDEDAAVPTPPPADRMSECLLSVRDVVKDRSDFARAFVALGGLDVLLGCVSERAALSRKVRGSCFDLLAVLAAGNVPIQLRLLDENAIRTMATLYFAEFPEAKKAHGEADEESDDEGTLRSQIVRAIDRSVVGHSGAEHKFYLSSRGRRVIEAGLGQTPAVSTRHLMGGASSTPSNLKRRCLYFLQDLLTSRRADKERYEAFAPAMTHVALRLTAPEDEADPKVRKAALETVVHTIRFERKMKKKGEVMVGMKKDLESLGEGRLEELRGDKGDDAETEKDLWTAVLAELERS